jgi:hypothetical protein
VNITCAVSTLFEIVYNYENWQTVVERINFRKDVLNSKNTYWLIFNSQTSGNREAFDYLITYPGIKIIHQSIPAVNGNSGYGNVPRNFLMVFEYEEPVQSMSEMPSKGE